MNSRLSRFAVAGLANQLGMGSGGGPGISRCSSDDEPACDHSTFRTDAKGAEGRGPRPKAWFKNRRGSTEGYTPESWKTGAMTDTCAPFFS